MLQLLVAEPHQRLERMLIAEPVLVAQFQHLGIDEPLHQPEHVGIGAALDLAHEPLLSRRQRGERVGQDEPVRKELVGGVEPASPDDVRLHLPVHPLGRLDRARIPLALRECDDGSHVRSPLQCADRMDEPAG